MGHAVNGDRTYRKRKVSFFFVARATEPGSSYVPREFRVIPDGRYKTTFRTNRLSRASHLPPPTFNITTFFHYSQFSPFAPFIGPAIFQPIFLLFPYSPRLYPFFTVQDSFVHGYTSVFVLTTEGIMLRYVLIFVIIYTQTL